MSHVWAEALPGATKSTSLHLSTATPSPCSDTLPLVRRLSRCRNTCPDLVTNTSLAHMAFREAVILLMPNPMLPTGPSMTTHPQTPVQTGSATPQALGTSYPI